MNLPAFTLDMAHYKRVFAEDECLVNDPSRDTAEAWWARTFGVRLAHGFRAYAVAEYDGGDAGYLLMPNGYVIEDGCDQTTNVYAPDEAPTVSDELLGAYRRLARATHPQVTGAGPEAVESAVTAVVRAYLLRKPQGVTDDAWQRAHEATRQARMPEILERTGEVLTAERRAAPDARGLPLRLMQAQGALAEVIVDGAGAPHIYNAALRVAAVALRIAEEHLGELAPPRRG